MESSRVRKDPTRHHDHWRAGGPTGAADQRTDRSGYVPFAASPVRLHLDVAGVRIDHVGADDIADRVRDAVLHPAERPVALASVNLDHVFQFGSGSPRTSRPHPHTGDGIDWVMLADGSPIAWLARREAGVRWPRVAGSDLLPPLLHLAEHLGATVGFLGGEPGTEAVLRAAAVRSRPGLQVAGVWTPPRAVINDPEPSYRLARTIAAAGPDILVVGLGKPRQEEWISRHGLTTGARVLAAFGAAADFLTGRATRAPLWMRRSGIEWSYRLAREPRRLSRRYLAEGPVAMWRLLREPATITWSADRRPAPGHSPVEDVGRAVTEPA